MSMWAINLPLTLPDCDGFHDRLYITETARGTTTYIVQTRLGSAPLTPASLEAAQGQAAKSRDPIAVSARKELSRRR